MRLSVYRNGWDRWVIRIGRIVLVVGWRTSTWVPMRVMVTK